MVYYKQIKEGEEATNYTYYENQYEDLVDDGRFYFMENVPARYIEPELPEYRGNMLIEALPPAYDLSHTFSKLKKYPLYYEKERYKDYMYRDQAIYRLYECVVPFVQYTYIIKKITALIRRGYVSRSVMNREFNVIMSENNKIMKEIDKKNKYTEMRCISNCASAPFPGFALIGISGGGKSTALRNILSLYPQCIDHTNYDGHNFLFRQLTYIKIDCPHKGSLKGICKAFFEKVDEVLGTEYLLKFGKDRSSEEDMVTHMTQITQLHALGVLVIDELQHLARSSNKEDVLNFFVNLENRMYVPIIYCGTYKTIHKLLGSDYRQARRTSGIGETHWNHMENDRNFEYFLSEIWRYQWLHNYTEITKDFVDKFYELTIGIPDRVVKLFMATQLEAILSREEKITSDIIEKVANEYMKLTKPMIDALKSGNPEAIKLYEDMYSIDYDVIRESYKNAFQYQEEIAQMYKNRNKEVEMKQQEIKNELIITMIDIGLSEKEATKKASQIIKGHGYNAGISFLKTKILEKCNSDAPDTKGDKSIKKKEKINESDTIEQTGYEKLQKEGKIKNIN